MTIYVTKSFLPPLEEFLPYLKQMWDSRVLSNCGPYHRQLEDELCRTLKVEHIALVNNGTIALLLALKALELEDSEIITTPYSFVATSSAILWSRNTPVFVDILPGSAAIDPSKIEAAITPKTRAIMAVHCYGHPCDTAKIDGIAQKHRLKVIYDAAHAFAVETEGGSLLPKGDLSVLSFHATKSFNTFEGGAIVCRTADMKEKVDRLKNFGFDGHGDVKEVGINAKMSEFNAAIGLLQLKHFARATAMREKIDQFYRALLQGVGGIECMDNKAATRKNYNYFPILVKEAYPLTRDELDQALKAHDIHGRRYFYPLITDFPEYSRFPSAAAANLPVAAEMAGQILCLPIYPELPLETVELVCKVIKSHEHTALRQPSRAQPL